MSSDGADTRGRRLVELAARMLPAEHRLRYRQEFVSELYGMPRSLQLRHAARILSRSWALRVALAEAATATIEGTAVTKTPRPRLCRLNLHRYRTVTLQDRERYFRCTKCGKEVPAKPFFIDVNNRGV